MTSREIKLHYGQKWRMLEIDEHNLLGVVEPVATAETDVQPIIEQSLDNPIGSARLDQLVKNGDRVTILIDDNTRPTPAYLILGPVIKRLLAAGVTKENVTIVVAGGTHRPMTPEEKRAKVGDRVFEDYEVLDHLWMDKDQLVMLEETTAGVPVEVNRLVPDADLCIGIGDIAPHPLAGWSGGGKIIEPGVCGEATTSAVHGQMIFYPAYSFLGIENCLTRLNIEHVARKAGLDFIVNTVLDAEHNIIGVFSGDLVKAHRAGVECASKVWTCPITNLADIVVASSYPADLDFWQAQKTLHFMECAIKRGGEMILLTPCPEGISQEENHRDVICKYASFSSKDIPAKASAGGEWDNAAVTVAVHVALTRELANITIVSDGLSASHCEAMGMNHCNNLNEAFQAVLTRTGDNAKVLVLTHGPKMIPVLS